MTYHRRACDLLSEDTVLRAWQVQTQMVSMNSSSSGRGLHARNDPHNLHLISINRVPGTRIRMNLGTVSAAFRCRSSSWLASSCSNIIIVPVGYAICVGAESGIARKRHHGQPGVDSGAVGASRRATTSARNCRNSRSSRTISIQCSRPHNDPLQNTPLNKKPGSNTSSPFSRWGTIRARLALDVQDIMRTA